VPGLDPAVAAVRVAVRRALVAAVKASADRPSIDRPSAADRPSADRPSADRPSAADRSGLRVLVACSGGADSVALAAATAVQAPALGVLAGLVTVDHGLQPGSGEQAAAVAELGRRLRLEPVRALRVEVGTAGGPEAAARAARYAALRAAATAAGAAYVLLGHTLDDQAETVLLGLGRGSGPRSVAGMRPVDPPWLRPLLGIRRASTTAACAAEGLAVWADPHNADLRFTRARLRHEVLPLLEEVLQGGVAEALGRTAALLRADLDALDAEADRVGAGLTGRDPRVEPVGWTLDAVRLAEHPAAIRTRVLRAWLAAAGTGPLTSVHLQALDSVVAAWRGQGPVALPGGLAVSRRHGRLHLDRPQGASQQSRARADPPRQTTLDPDTSDQDSSDDQGWDASRR
jgi:tRNA(Ile)-lysidine synthase